MKRSAMLLALPLMLSIAVAQNQPSGAAPPKPESQSDSSGYPAEHIDAPKTHVKPPRVIYSPDPPYPKKAHKPRHQDSVLLWLVVGGDGLPRDVKVERSLSPEFDEAAMDAVKKWKFEPGMKDGKPIAVQIRIEITFKR